MELENSNLSLNTISYEHFSKQIYNSFILGHLKEGIPSNYFINLLCKMYCVYFSGINKINSILQRFEQVENFCKTL